MRRFELSDGTSNKFWEIGQDGCNVDVCYGKIGAAGTTQRKTHADEARAAAAMDKLIREKTAKGYVETTASEPMAPAAPAPASPDAPDPAMAPTAAGATPPWLDAAPVALAPELDAHALPSRRRPCPGATRAGPCILSAYVRAARCGQATLARPKPHR